jgi:hypothetical protein
VLEKIKRTVDKKMISFVRTQRCCACGRMGAVDAHHVTTRGAGGGDTENNLMPLCHEHHTEWHMIGPSKMIDKYDGVYTWLWKMGRDDVIDRALREKTTAKGDK